MMRIETRRGEFTDLQISFKIRQEIFGKMMMPVESVEMRIRGSQFFGYIHTFTFDYFY